MGLIYTDKALSSAHQQFPDFAGSCHRACQVPTNLSPLPQPSPLMSPSLPAPPPQLPTQRIRRDSDRERVGKAMGVQVYKVCPLFSSFFLLANALPNLAPLARKICHTGVCSCSMIPSPCCSPSSMENMPYGVFSVFVDPSVSVRGLEPKPTLTPIPQKREKHTETRPYGHISHVFRIF